MHVSIRVPGYYPCKWYHPYTYMLTYMQTMFVFLCGRRHFIQYFPEEASGMHPKCSTLKGRVDADRRRQKMRETTRELQRGERLRKYVDRDENNSRFSGLSADDQRVLEEYDTGRTAKKMKTYAVPRLSTFRSTE